MAETGIVKFVPNAGLTKREADIVLASRGIRIFHMDNKELWNLITTVITMALFDLGHKMEEKDRDLLQERLMQDLIKYFGKYTDQEFRKAVELGVRGEFKSKEDDVVFVNLKSINEWMKKYGNGLKVEAMKKNRILEEKKEKEMEEQNIEEKKKQSELIIIEDLKASYATFKAGGLIRDPLNVLYDYLDRQGLVKLSNDRKKKIYDQAFEEFKSWHTEGSSVSEYMANKKIMAEIEQGSSRVQALVKALAKQKALKVIFQDMKELDLSMEDYLNGVD